MRRLKILSLLSVSLVCAHPIGPASSQTSVHRSFSAAQVRRQLQALYDQASLAAMHNDMKAYGRSDAPDFFIIHPDGTTMNKAQMNQAAAADASALGAPEGLRPRTVKETRTIQSIVLQDSGRRAVVVVKLHSVMTVRIAQKTQGAVIDMVSMDTWVKTAPGWLRQSSRPVAPKTGQPTRAGQPPNKSLQPTPTAPLSGSSS